ncbi:MAG: hypothetical protein EA341_15345 [Mongoliibacter sp.]|uniref:hypothetical protein n=1 Tax=Mongoliibacter sp. TaxID=2022438 RepID=UPI0012F0BE77|nr:hypothetical protein [Mongoliibacter sp.]TVP45318.1 MAG: hypothetical protein EA341_15345 [Mongoliibacter sp.]
MKKALAIAFLITAISFSSFSQEKSSDPVFDYSETKHELSLDIAPIIGGNYPSNLLYRQHYVSKKGNDVAFRLGARIGASISSTESDNSTPENISRNNQNFSVFLGKEWQKQIQSRIIGYYGVDLELGYGRFYFDASNTTDGRVFTNQVDNFFNIGTIGFLGMRYHFTQHFSVSAETAANLNYSNSRFEGTFENNVNNTQRTNSLGLSMIPLRAIRFAFHF